MTNPNLFNIILVWPILNILIAIYQALNHIHVPYALGFAIIGLTIVIRLILYPLTHSQLKTTKKMQAITPHINKLKEKHKDDAKMLQSETMKLYKEHGVNPLAGCLPVIIQLPLIWALYGLLQQVVASKSALTVAQINKVLYFPALHLKTLWDQHFFGIPLGQTPAHLMSAMPLILLFPVLTGVLQFIQSKMMIAPVVKEEETPKTKKEKKELAKTGEKKEEKKPDDFATAFQSQSTYIFPLMIAFFSYNFPSGLSLYWNTFTIFGIIQQYQIQGLGGLRPLIAAVKAKIMPKTSK